MNQFIRELKRRKVFRVVIGYLIASWLTLQVADVLSSILALPEWVSRLVFFLLVIGLIPAVFLAWVYDITPEGIQRDDGEIETKGAAQSSGFKATMLGLLALVAGGLGAGLFWMSGADKRWVNETAIPEIEQLVATDKWEQAFQKALEVETRLGEHGVSKDLWSQFTVTTTFRSQPEGATVLQRAYDDPDGKWREFGRTPIHDVRIPIGFSLVRFELEGYETVERIVGSMPISGGTEKLTEEEEPTGTDLFLNPMDVVLDPTGVVPSTMVRVPGTQVRLNNGEAVRINPFYIGRNEVTNKEYLAFVEAGGYRQRDLWDHEFLRDGQALSWDQAIAEFMDSTNRPGPSTWIGGTYPDGQADYPVGGISWYEAAAFARFARMELPTLHHWKRAHAHAAASWQVPGSNVEDSGVAPVGQYHGIGWTGTRDMLGNVREWVENAQGDQRIILGGAWDNARYTVLETLDPPDVLPPLDRSSQNGVRLASLNDDRRAKELLSASIEAYQTVELTKPASDEVFAALLRNFEYSSDPLNPRVEAVDELPYSTRHQISFDTGDRDQRTELFLYLPKTKTSRHRVVFYWPTSLAIQQTSIEGYRLHVNFLLRRGWAVALPVFEGTFHRGKGQPTSGVTVAGRDLLIRQVREMRRTLDYLETRPDLDTDALVFYGFSWGGRVGSLALAIEPRFKVGILNQAGHRPRLHYDIKTVHYLPRVYQPVLQFNGRYDTVFRHDDLAKPFFDMLGSEHKKHVVEATGHFVNRSVVIGETLAWLDEYVGGE